MTPALQRKGRVMSEQRWIEIYESLPPDGQLVLWLRPADKRWPVTVGRRDGNSVDDGGDLVFKIEPFVTHWMPLPELPAELRS